MPAAHPHTEPARAKEELLQELFPLGPITTGAALPETPHPGWSPRSSSPALQLPQAELSRREGLREGTAKGWG